jgi:hypothetical protein
MAVPSTFADLSTTPASNSGLISDSTAVNQIDNHAQSIYAFLGSIYTNSGNGWAAPYLTAANPSYTGTLTGGTGVVNLGSGQFYKDGSGNVGIGTSTLTFFDGSGLSVARAGTSTLRLWDTSNSKRLELSVSGTEAKINSGDSAIPINVYVASVLHSQLLKDGGILLKNVAVAPSTPTAGGVLYVESGALTYNGSSGTVSIVAPA